MVKISRNVLLSGLSGTFGKEFVIQKNGVIRSLPDKTKLKRTDGQKKNSNRFLQANAYAKTIKTDPELYNLYKAACKPGQRPHNLAISDFLHSPVIEDVDLTNYKGKSGDTIRITARDDFKVTEISLKIVLPDGKLVEQGAAVQKAGSFDWIFITRTNNADLAGTQVIVDARDLPGNITERSFVCQ